MFRLSSASRLVVVLLLLSLLPAVLPAQVGAAWSGCKTDSLSIFNCASYYSGTVTMTSELKTPNGTERTEITAAVNAGRVNCTVTATGQPEYGGRGMIAVEHSSTENSGEYDILVWCPDEPGQAVSRRDAAGIEIKDQESGNYARLVGKDSYEHPDTDEVNGVSGSVTVTWRLERR